MKKVVFHNPRFLAMHKKGILLVQVNEEDEKEGHTSLVKDIDPIKEKQSFVLHVQTLNTLYTFKDVEESIFRSVLRGARDLKLVKYIEMPGILELREMEGEVVLSFSDEKNHVFRSSIVKDVWVSEDLDLVKVATFNSHYIFFRPQKRVSMELKKKWEKVKKSIKR